MNTLSENNNLAKPRGNVITLAYVDGRVLQSETFPPTVPGKDSSEVASLEPLTTIREDTPATQFRIAEAQNIANSSAITSVGAIQEFAEDRKLRGCTRQTIHGNYVPFLRNFLKAYSMVPTDPKLIRQLLAPFRKNTACTYWLYLSAFYNFLEKEHGIPNPMRNIPRSAKEKTLPDHLNPDQKGALNQVRFSARDKAIIKLFTETAVRPGEVAATRGHPLRFCDIYDDHIEVTGKTGERFVPIAPELRETILSLRNGRPADSAVFVDNKEQPLTTWGLRKVVKRAFKAAGINGVKATPYTLRHSFGGEFLANGGDLATLQKIMGHADIKTTMIYTHIADKALVEAYRRHGPRATNTL